VATVLTGIHMIALRRSLDALACPLSQDFDPENTAHCVKLVRWLEDRKVRELEIHERTLLDEGPDWEDNFNKYLGRLSLSDASADGPVLEKIYWLVQHAIALEYEDTDLSQNTSTNPATSSPRSSISDQLEAISTMLGLQRSTTDTDTGTVSLLEFDVWDCAFPYYLMLADLLSRIHHALKCSVSPDAVAARSGDWCELQNSDKLLEYFPLGFDTGGMTSYNFKAVVAAFQKLHNNRSIYRLQRADKVVNKVALVLKMLYLSDFRDLQNEVNALLVLVQEFTANP
jgi:hypothetical protein